MKVLDESIWFYDPLLIRLAMPSPVAKFCPIGVVVSRHINTLAERRFDNILVWVAGSRCDVPDRGVSIKVVGSPNFTSICV